MKDRLVPAGAQCRERSLGEAQILEAAAGQHDARFADPRGDGRNGFGKTPVESTRDHRGRLSRPQIGKRRLERRLPIQH